MHSVLVIQLARMGDFLQTAPLLEHIKSRYRDCTLSVLIDSALKPIAASFPWIDDVLCVKTDEIERSVKTADSLSSLYDDVKNILSFLDRKVFDSIINLNSTPLTAILGSIPGAVSRLGYFYSNNRFVTDPWFQFFHAMVRSRSVAPFNLVDFFYFLIGKPGGHPQKISYNINAVIQQRAADVLRTEGIGVQPCVLLHIGARHHQRRWPINAFIQLAEHALRYPDLHILITGKGREEASRGRHLESALSTVPGSRSLRRVHNMINRTTVDELAGILSRASLLVSCDTGVLHLAASVDCPSIALFFGSAYAYNTGPYGTVHYTLQSRNNCSPCFEDSPCTVDFACRDAIEPSTVIRLMDCMLRRDRVDIRSSNDADVLKGMFDGWGIVYRPAVPRAVTLGDIQRFCYRETGKYLISNHYVTSRSSLLSFLDSFSFPDIHYITAEIQSVIKSAERMMCEYHQHSPDMCRFMIDGDFTFWNPLCDCYNHIASAPTLSADKHRASFTASVSFGAQLLNSLQTLLQ